MDEAPEDVEIPIWVEGDKKWLTGLTRRTTCDDVIYALLVAVGSNAEDLTQFYSIFERWRDVERQLQGRTKIVKIWRSWGSDQKNVKLSMRRTDELTFTGEHSNRGKRHRKSRTNRDARPSTCFCPECIGKTKEGNAAAAAKFKNLVLSQERDVQTLYDRILQMDKAINIQESLINEGRARKRCMDDAQKAYLHNDDGIEDALSNVEPDKHNIYIKICDMIIDIDERLDAERDKIRSVQRDIEHELRLKSEFEENHKMQQRIEYLKEELTEAISRGVFLAVELEQLTKVIESTESQLRRQKQYLEQLLTEIVELNIFSQPPLLKRAANRADTQITRVSTTADDLRDMEEAVYSQESQSSPINESVSSDVINSRRECTLATTTCDAPEKSANYFDENQWQSTCVDVSTLSADFKSHLTVETSRTTQEENDSDTGLSSMNSEDVTLAGSRLETLV